MTSDPKGLVSTKPGQLHFDGRAVAQVFVAPESLISSITVWRPATEQVNITGMHLFITDVTPGTATPDPLSVLLDGPTLVLPYTGATAKPVTYEFDPPFELPHTGTFAFAIKQESPDCVGLLSLMADSTSAYSDGDAWTIYPFVTCEGLGRSPPFHRNEDLVFQVQFCIGVVPTERTTWGGVKAHYR